jgi:hypothetical protein
LCLTRTDAVDKSASLPTQCRPAIPSSKTTKISDSDLLSVLPVSLVRWAKLRRPVF